MCIERSYEGSPRKTAIYEVGNLAADIANKNSWTLKKTGFGNLEMSNGNKSIKILPKHNSSYNLPCAEISGVCEYVSLNDLPGAIINALNE